MRTVIEMVVLNQIIIGVKIEFIDNRTRNTTRSRE
jgi:hypothetical protein